MIKRTVYIENPCYISIAQGQLELNLNEKTGISTVPFEDLGFLVLAHPQIVVTQAVMIEAARHNTAVVFCNHARMPSTMAVHLDTYGTASEVYRSQLEASIPLKKQLWKQTVRAKIDQQLHHLEELGRNASALRACKNPVRSGDPGNEEGKAARAYWRLLLGTGFRRERKGEAPNPALNYGYAILRAATARALAGSGLLNALGIHHHNRYNHFCLADDIMEPYRPFVDRIVLDMVKNGEETQDLNKEAKASLLQVTTCDVNMGSQRRPLMVALQETSASLRRCFAGEDRTLSYPKANG